jgi:uncharacterized glyoxalase superfamily protein PhnB
MTVKEKKFWKLSPHLPVKDVRETVKWYVENLGFGEEWYYNDPVTDGGCRRDEMRVLFGVSSSTFRTPEDLSLILFVDNVDEVYLEIQQRGLPVISPLKTYDYGIREFSIRDCNGYILRFSESVP